MSLIRTKCQCSQCKREDCKKCTNCIMNALSGRRSHTLRCFQTMCRKVSVAEKATKAEGNLPKDWYFYFDEKIVNVRVDGLFIFKKDHDRNHFESFEEAAACYPNEFGDMNAETFYKHVGIDYCKAMECIRKPDNPIGTPVENHHNHRSNIMNRDGLAALGLKRPGGVHFWPSNGNKKQKVNRKDSASNFSPQLECAHESIDPFSRQTSVVDDPLLRKGFWAEWIKVNGDIGTVVGQIIKVQLNKTLGCVPIKQYTVRYGNLRDDSTPEIAIIDSDKAWCGCIAFEERTSPENPVLRTIAPFHISWVTPTSYLRRCVDENGTQCLPRVSIQYKMFVLDFTVKQSTVLNAGYGVFLACKAWDLDDNKHRLKYFELPAGVLLDFGVYAPIRPEDKKEESEFRLKNFIHKFCCEKYLHAPAGSSLAEGNDFVFDITDDFTGKLHEEARRHVLPFVNEITSPESVVPNVHAIHDCSGAVHYLLGHEREEQGPFRMEVGSEMEIFVDYGDQYENVRLRHGYPRKDHHNILEAQKRLKNDELEFLKEVDSYTSQEVRNMIGNFRLALERKNRSKPMKRPNGQSAFATEVYTQDGMGVEVAGRMVLALLLLRKRSNSLAVEEELDDEQLFLMHETTKEYSRLVKRFIKTFWNNNINDLYLTFMDDEIYVDFMNTFFEGEKDLSLLISST